MKATPFPLRRSRPRARRTPNPQGPRAPVVQAFSAAKTSLSILRPIVMETVSTAGNARGPKRAKPLPIGGVQPWRSRPPARLAPRRRSPPTGPGPVPGPVSGPVPGPIRFGGYVECSFAQNGRDDALEPRLPAGRAQGPLTLCVNLIAERLAGGACDEWAHPCPARASAYFGAPASRSAISSASMRPAPMDSRASLLNLNNRGCS